MLASSVATLFALTTGLSGKAEAAIVIDGKINEPEWAQAQQFSNFKITEPYSLTDPDSGTATLAYLLSTPAGIVVAFKLEQAPGVPRVKPRLQRDQTKKSDKVNVVIDFDGDGLSAYSFSVGLSGAISDGVVTNETELNLDWDTDWSSAVTETDAGWQVEMLIPWTVAPMRGPASPQRTVGVYFGRSLGHNGVLQAQPAIAIERGRFLSGFERIEIPQYRTALFHYWPYLTANRDLLNDKTRYRSGVDVFWKPSPNFQLSATVNPDFGQVESDSLVINFDAVETFFGDKRPFFTENQSIFSMNTADSGKLIHTRRIGGDADDGTGASDINAAIKLNGSQGGMNYGVLVATEDGKAGRDFYVARLQYPLSPKLSLGWLGSLTDRPHLDRTANVQAVDLSWKPDSAISVDAQVLGSFIKQRGETTNDSGARLVLGWNPSSNWSYELEAAHFGNQLNFNDLGYQRRASLNELEASAQYIHRNDDKQSLLRSSRWQLETQARSNDRGDRLPGVAVLNSYLNFRSGELLFLQASASSSGWDDTISRGNGLWRRPSRQNYEAQFLSRRYGDWAFSGLVSLIPRGMSDKLSRMAGMTLSWYPSDTFNAEFEFTPEWTREWLVWDGGRNFGVYQRKADFGSLSLNWFPGSKHELRLKSEWIAMRASNGQGYQLQPTGRLTATGQAKADFDINKFGLQLRYRYSLGPQSDLFLAYSRGGSSELDRSEIRTGDLFDEALRLRDSDQILMKMRYRF
ncbi:DUF5916 domain-containing protein [Chitinimonas sp. JJ19]|uniref:DUF5916 domain-containing protein n=1 Tax=Chitinimonas sp. JJ19 TaxID=3109352 RepID=UPI0030026211